MSRIEKLRSMTEEELLSFAESHCVDSLCDIVCKGECKAFSTLEKSSKTVCKEIISKWLNSDVENESGNDSVNSIYENPREVAMQLEIALDFIRDRGMEKTAAALDTAIKYLHI